MATLRICDRFAIPATVTRVDFLNRTTRTRFSQDRLWFLPPTSRQTDADCDGFGIASKPRLCSPLISPLVNEGGAVVGRASHPAVRSKTNTKRAGDSSRLDRWERHGSRLHLPALDWKNKMKTLNGGLRFSVFSRSCLTITRVEWSRKIDPPDWQQLVWIKARARQKVTVRDLIPSSGTMFYRAVNEQN